MDNVVKYKTGFDVRPLFIYSLGIFLFCVILTAYFTSVLSEVVIYASTFMFCYIALYFHVNSYYFYEDRIEVRYFFRIINSVIIHNIEEISTVKYIHHAHKNSFPTIQLTYAREGMRTVRPSNSFVVYHFKKRKAILKFLDSKGIPIEIISDFEKDEKILT